MMSFLRRGQTPPPGAPPPDPDSPEALATALVALIRTVNRNAGRLPLPALVAARDVTDVVDELLDSVEHDATPDIQVILAVRGIVHDYLPTTLQRYLALDPSTVHQPDRAGRTPADHVVEQLVALYEAATDVLEASRAQDAADLASQGNFLRTKFSRSDLDL